VEVSQPSHADGFTLIELLIVVIILGVLAGIVVFAVGGTADSSGATACKAEAREFYNSYTAHKANNHGAKVAGADAIAMARNLYVTSELSKGALMYYAPGRDGKSWTFDVASESVDDSACR
jgi:prepilin-type N-terminal cleavage/methylation domain-containing protein